MNDGKKRCFLIGPIGKDDSEVRIAADFFREDIVKAALGSEFDVKRADDYSQAGNITSQVIQAINNAEIIVADLTGRNPNVYYELGVAHSYKKHVVPMKSQDDPDVIPFDNYTERTIFYSTKSVELRNKAKEELGRAVTATLRDLVSNPVTTALGLEKKAADGDNTQQILSNLSSQLAEVTRTVQRQQQLLLLLDRRFVQQSDLPENALRGAMRSLRRDQPRNALDAVATRILMEGNNLPMEPPAEDPGDDQPPGTPGHR